MFVINNQLIKSKSSPSSGFAECDASTSGVCVHVNDVVCRDYAEHGFYVGNIYVAGGHKPTHPTNPNYTPPCKYSTRAHHQCVRCIEQSVHAGACEPLSVHWVGWDVNDL